MDFDVKEMTMVILPSLDETILSKKSIEDICEALGAVTVPRKEHRFGDSRGEFIGEVDTAGFKIVKNISYRDSFCPIITGSIRTEGRISIITIKMRMHWFVSIFTIIWFGIVTLFMLMGLFMVIVDRNDFILLCGAGGMMLIGQILVRSGFYIPAKKALKRMKELFGE